MATQALVDATTWIDAFDWTVNTNALTMTETVEALDSTTFSSAGWRSRTAGLRNVAFQMRGYTDAATTDVQSAGTLLGGTLRVATVAPAAAATSVAYMFRGRKFSVANAAPLGQMAGFDINMEGSDGVGRVRGQVAKTKGTVSATGVMGSVVNLGAVGSTQSLYATLHLFVAGTTVTILVESDDSAGFTTPTTVATIGPLTATGGTWMTPVAGPLTDSFFRFNVSAITGTFTIAGAIGIR